MLDLMISPRRMLLSVLFIGVAHNVAAAQGRASGAQSCALFTKPLMEKFSAASKKSVDPAGPKELALGSNGTACEWGDLMVQLDPISAANLETLRQRDSKNWEVIDGVGDVAYLHNVQDVAAELYVRSGKHTFVVVATIPLWTKTAAFKPAILDVGRAILPKVR